ncbi:MAG: tetratricopeptide repeat protein [Thermodesulfobacteriota bacterium]
MELLSKLIASRLLSALFLFLLSFALYSPSLRNDFVWDDIEMITKQNVNYDPSSIIYYVIPGDIENKQERYYRPIVYISWVADNGLWGISPFGYHLSNLLFHSLSVVLFYVFAVLLLRESGAAGSEAAAFLAALLFTLYPMHVESVSWIAGRSDVLCALFLFLAFICHILSYRRAWYLALTGLSLLLSLFSKEVAIVFPLLALVFDLMNRRLFNWKNLPKYAVYLGVTLLYLYLRGLAFEIPEINQGLASEGVKQAVIPGEQISSIPIYIGLSKTLLGSFLAYMDKLVFPFGFNPFITSVPKEFPYIISSIVLLAVLAALSFISINKRENITAFGIFWILVTLAPSMLIAIVSISPTPLAERYLYIPSAGFCLLTGYWLVEAARRAHFRAVAWGLGFLLIVSYAVVAYKGQGIWRDDLALWRDTSLKSPHHPLPHSNYGLALSNNGDHNGAIREFKIALSPELKDSPRGLAITANNMALVYLDKGEYERAEIWFRKALGYDPGYGKTYYHLGLIYYINGEMTGSADSYIEAERYVKEALKRYQYYGRANLLLAKIYLKTGDTDKARKAAQAAIGIGLPENLLEEARDILEIDDNRSYQEPQ